MWVGWKCCHLGRSRQVSCEPRIYCCAVRCWCMALRHFGDFSPFSRHTTPDLRAAISTSSCRRIPIMVSILGKISGRVGRGGFDPMIDCASALII